jgi:hypothetical protein
MCSGRSSVVRSKAVRPSGHVASKCGMLEVRDMNLVLEVERRRVRAER